MDVTRQLENEKKPIVHCFRPDFYLRARIRYILSIIDHIVPRKFRYEVQERLRDLVIELRNSRGRSVWPVIVAAAFAFGFIYLAHPWAKTRVLCALPGCSPQISFRVIAPYNKRDFLLQRVVDGVPEPPEMRRFDEDSPFEAGHTISWLKFEDLGSVWSVRGTDPYFRLERVNGLATVPPNCLHTHPENSQLDHVVCKGEPKW